MQVLREKDRGISVFSECARYYSADIYATRVKFACASGTRRRRRRRRNAFRTGRLARRRKSERFMALLLSLWQVVRFFSDTIVLRERIDSRIARIPRESQPVRASSRRDDPFPLVSFKRRLSSTWRLADAVIRRLCDARVAAPMPSRRRRRRRRLDWQGVLLFRLVSPVTLRVSVFSLSIPSECSARTRRVITVARMRRK